MKSVVMQTSWIRRPIIIVAAIVTIVVLTILFVAETIWETLKSIVSIVGRLISESKPTVSEFIEYVREVW